jgi:hypothetical protein
MFKVNSFKKHFESKKETIVDKKIKFLKDFFLELEDIGLRIYINCYNPKHHGSFEKHIPLISVDITDNKYLISKPGTNLCDTDEIKNIFKRLKDFGIQVRGYSGGDNNVMIYFDRYNNSRFPKDLLN